MPEELESDTFQKPELSRFGTVQTAVLLLLTNVAVDVIDSVEFSAAKRQTVQE